MTEQAPALTRHDIEAKIIKRCWENEAFHKEFTADPVGTAVKYLQVPAASVPKIVVHEEPAGSWHIVLPAKPAEAGELSDADLEKVAGGTLLPLLGSLVIHTVTAFQETVNRGWWGLSALTPGELSDEDLEKVAGGVPVTPTVTVVAVTPASTPICGVVATVAVAIVATVGSAVIGKEIGGW